MIIQLFMKFMEQLRSQGHVVRPRYIDHLLQTVPVIHEMTSFRRGDWVIWRCPICENHEIRLNPATGEFSSTPPVPGIVHHGINKGAETMDALSQNLSPN